MGTERELLRGRWRYDFLQFGVRPHPAEVFVFMDVGQVAIAFFLGFLQALQAAIHVASFGLARSSPARRNTGRVLPDSRSGR